MLSGSDSNKFSSQKNAMDDILDGNEPFSNENYLTNNGFDQNGNKNTVNNIGYRNSFDYNASAPEKRNLRPQIPGLFSQQPSSASQSNIQNNKSKNKSRGKLIDVNIRDSVFIVILTALSVYTRTLRIQHPKIYTTAEVLGGNITNLYLRGIFFNAVNPPLSDIILAAFAKLENYEISYPFESNEEKSYVNHDYVALRFIPAIFNSLCIPISYLIGRLIGLNQHDSFMLGLLMTFDTLMISQSRVIKSDGIFYLFAFLAIFSIYNHSYFQSKYTFVFECFCVSLSLCCRYSAIAIVALAVMKELRLNDTKKRTRVMYIIISVLVGQYFAYSLHLNLLPFAPDESEEVEIPDIINRSLLNFYAPDYKQRINQPSMLRRIAAVLAKMPSEIRKQTAYANYSSSWFTWPLFTSKWVMIWRGTGMYSVCLENILLTYPVFAGVVYAVGKKFMGKVDPIIEEMMFGYFVSLLSYIFCPGKCFVYDYTIPLVFGIINLVLCINRYASPWKKGFLLAGTAGISFLGFIIFAKVVYTYENTELGFHIFNRHWDLAQQ